MTPVARIQSRNLSTVVANELSERMRIGPLRMGDKLPTEAAIMQEFGVSRTVVREALSKLQAAGMVKSQRGVGSFVIGAARTKPFHVDSSPDDSLDEAVALIELRLGLEGEAAALAAQRHNAGELDALRSALDALQAAMDEGMDTAVPDFQFHLQIARMSRSPHFAAVMEALGPTCVPTALLIEEAEKGDGASWRDLVRHEHLSIFQAIEQRDADAARTAMRLHLVNGRERRRACDPTRPASPS